YPAATRIISGALDALNGVSPLPQGTADAYFRLGWLYDVPGQDDTHAKTAYTRVIALDPKNALAYNNRGSIYYDHGALGQALADYIQAIMLDPKYAPAYINRGNVYYRQGELDKALDDYSQAIALDPKLAQTYYDQGNVFPKLAAAYYNRGLFYSKQGALDKA